MADYRSTSPQTSELLSEMDSFSAREQVPLSRTTTKPVNFKSAYVSVQEVTKPVVHGRKTIAFWTLICLLLMLTVGNLIITVVIMTTLRFGYGMESIEILPDEQGIKFFGDIDLDHVYKKDGRLEGFEGEDMEIIGDDGPILLNVVSKSGRPISKVRIDKNETVFSGFKFFNIRDLNDNLLLSLHEPTFHNLQNVKNFEAERVITNKIRSPINKGLRIEGEESIRLKGAEGTTIDGKEIRWQADQGIYLRTNGSIILSGQEGTYIDVNRIPVVKLDGKSYVKPQYKICVCMPEGKLFRIPVEDPNSKVYCHHINMSPEHNPCL